MNLVAIEKMLKANVLISGKKVPLKGKLDLKYAIWAMWDIGDTRLEDGQKFIPEPKHKENYKYVFQAWFYVLLAELGYMANQLLV